MAFTSPNKKNIFVKIKRSNKKTKSTKKAIITLLVLCIKIAKLNSFIDFNTFADISTTMEQTIVQKQKKMKERLVK